MSKETFQYPKTKTVFQHLEDASHRSGVSRSQVFEDFLHLSVCALSGGRMEEEYLATVAKHTHGETGKRGCDHIARAFASLIEVMEKTRQDILGDLFQVAISHGENGLFLTPEPVCDLMARISLGEKEDGLTARKTVCDPCCGSGRLLLAAGRIRPHADFVGQDVDLRCVRITTLNLALWGRYAHVVWGNSLTHETKLVYRTGFDGRGFAKAVPPEESPFAARQIAQQARERIETKDIVDGTNDDTNESSSGSDASIPSHDPLKPKQQLFLF